MNRFDLWNGLRNATRTQHLKGACDHYTAALRFQIDRGLRVQPFSNLPFRRLYALNLGHIQSRSLLKV